MPSSAFSDENPFQSGSSPLNIEASRRRTAGTSNERRRSSSNRRKTDGAPITTIKQEEEKDNRAPISKTFEMSLSALRNPRDRSGSVETGEEFAPEEQIELSTQLSESNSKAVSRNRKDHLRRKPSIPKSAPWLVISALLLGYATWYRQEKLSVGYCGLGRSSGALSNVHAPEWASHLVPTCEPCPQHTICYEGMVTRCESDYAPQLHPLSLGGILPLPPTCEPDGCKSEKDQGSGRPRRGDIERTKSAGGMRHAQRRSWQAFAG